MEIDKFYIKFGNRLKYARKKLGLSQDYIGAAIGLSRQSISNIEAGRQRILAHHASQLSHALSFKIPVDNSLQLIFEVVEANMHRLKRRK